MTSLPFCRLAAVVLASSLPVCGQVPSATYRGETGAHWLTALKDARSDEGRRQAAVALHHLVAEDPELLKAAAQLGQDHPGEVRTRVAFALQSSGPEAVPALRRWLADPNEEVRSAAFHALETLGDQARDAVQDLIQLLGAEDHDDAIIALGRIGGPAATAVLLERLGAKRTHREVFAAQALGPAAQPALLRLLDDPARRDGAATVLLATAPEDPEVRRAVGDELDGLSLRTRWEWFRARALHDGVGVAEFLAAHRDLVADGEKFRGETLPFQPGLEDDLLAALVDDDLVIRQTALRIIGTAVPPISPQVLTGVTHALEDGSPSLRQHAASVLRDWGPAASPAETELKQRLASETDQDVRAILVLALGSVSPSDKGISHVISQSLDAGGAEADAAHLMLGKRDTMDAAARGFHLARALLSEQGWIQWSAAEFLADPPGGAHPVWEHAVGAALAFAIDDPATTPDRRRSSLFAAGRVGTLARTAGPALRRAFAAHPNDPAVQYALRALGHHGADLVPPVARALRRHPTPELLESLAHLLDEPQQAEGMTIFMRHLSHDRQDIQRAAGEGLRKVGPAAVPHLIEALGSSAPGSDQVDAAYFAAEALRGMPYPAVCGPLTDAAQGPHAGLAGRALRILGTHPGLPLTPSPPADLVALTATAARHDHWVVRAGSAYVAHRIGDAPTLARLRQDVDRYVRQACQEAQRP